MTQIFEPQSEDYIEDSPHTPDTAHHSPFSTLPPCPRNLVPALPRRDASGMTLEKEAIDTSLSKLAPSGWTPGIAYDAEADEELMEDDRVEAVKREDRNKRSGFFSCKQIICPAEICLSL